MAAAPAPALPRSASRELPAMHSSIREDAEGEYGDEEGALQDEFEALRARAASRRCA